MDTRPKASAQAEFIRRDPAGEYLKETYGFGSKKTLDKLAVTGGGPPYRLCGRIPLYTIADLDEWALSKIGPLMHSTSEYGAKRSSFDRNEATSVEHRYGEVAKQPRAPPRDHSERDREEVT